MKSHCPWSVLLGLLQWCSSQEFLLGGLASHGRSELLMSWFLPAQHRWPSLCSHLGQLSGWQWLWWPPHLFQLLCLLYPFVQLLLTGRGYLYWCWGSTNVGGASSTWTWALSLLSGHTPLSLSLGSFLSLPFWNLNEREIVCQYIGNHNSLKRVMQHPSQIFNYCDVIAKGSTFHMMKCLLLQSIFFKQTNMADECKIHEWILERDDEEF